MLIGIDASRAFVEDRTGTENYSYWTTRKILELDGSQIHDWVIFTRGEVEEEPWMKAKNIRVVNISLPRLWTQVGLAYYTWKKYKFGGKGNFLDLLWVPAHTLPVLRKPGVKTLVTLHGIEYEWLPEYKNILQRWYLPLSTVYAVKSADWIIAVSEFTKGQIIDKLGADVCKISVILEGVVDKLLEEKPSKRSFAKLKKKYGISGQYIMFVGSLQPRKNLEFMIRVFARLRNRFEDLQFVIVGADGWMTEDIYMEVKRENVDKSVIFTGRLLEEEKNRLLREALLYVQPSITEGFGLPIVEAMATGTAVVTSRGGALPEVVGNAGKILPGSQDEEFDLEIWVRELSELLSNQATRKDFAIRGKRRAKELNWKKTAVETLKVIETLSI